MAAVAEVRKDEARHADQPVHVRLEDGALVLLGGRGEGVAPEAQAGVVEEDVDAAAELRDGLLDEAGGALRIGHVELEADVGLEPVAAPRPAGHARALACERAGGRSADSRRGAGDDRGLSLEGSHGLSLTTLPRGAPQRVAAFWAGVPSAACPDQRDCGDGAATRRLSAGGARGW